VERGIDVLRLGHEPYITQPLYKDTRNNRLPRALE
jgi:hypothetical protein